MSWNVAWAEDQIKNGGRVGPKRVMEQLYKHNDMKDKFTEAIRLMKLDLAYFEEKYQGKFLELPHIGLGNRKTRCVNEATLPIVTCHPSCLEKCADTSYVLRICTLPRPACRNCSEHGTGCCGSGDIRFNVVGESGWAVKAEQKNYGRGVRNDRN